MDNTKIKIKVGEHEFEAEGPVETVQAQLEAFKVLIGNLGTTPMVTKPSPTQEVITNQSYTSQDQPFDVSKILHVSGRVVSLTALPASTEDSSLLIMLGHKEIRNNISVTGQEIGDGLAQSGRPVPRVDRIMEKSLADAFVLKTGRNRATRYRLTNQGYAKAMALAKELSASLP